MATCPGCGTGKMVKRNDGWFHCKRHGPVRKIGDVITRRNVKVKFPVFSRENMEAISLDKEKIEFYHTARIGHRDGPSWRKLLVIQDEVVEKSKAKVSS